MLITPHTVTGAALVILIPEKGIAFPLAFASHLVLDSIPHWDFTPDARHMHKMVPDMLIAAATLGLMTWLSGAPWQLIATGASLAILPDIIQQLDHVGNVPWLKPFFALHNKVQRSATVLPGIMVQMAVVLACLLIVA